MYKVIIYFKDDTEEHMYDVKELEDFKFSDRLVTFIYVDKNEPTKYRSAVYNMDIVANFIVEEQ